MTIIHKVSKYPKKRGEEEDNVHGSAKNIIFYTIHPHITATKMVN